MKFLTYVQISLRVEGYYPYSCQIKWNIMKLFLNLVAKLDHSNMLQFTNNLYLGTLIKYSVKHSA